MTPNNETTAIHSSPTRAQQQDARAWAKFTGGKYTEALRQMRSPLAQGLLGERVSARTLIETLTEHEVVAADEVGSVLGDDGYHSDFPWDFDGKTDFIRLALVTEALRMFTPIPETAAPEVNSYSLKHTVEAFLGQYELDYAYVTNGQLIWAAAAMGLKLSTHNAAGDGHAAGPNLWVGIAEREYDYVDRLIRSEIPPGAHHFRPARYLRLQEVLVRAAAGEIITEDWTPPAQDGTETPFHDWMLGQAERKDPVGDLSRDYAAGVHVSEHGIAATPDDLLRMFTELPHAESAYDALVLAIGEYMSLEPAPAPIRTERTSAERFQSDGYGAGAGSVERYDYLCPCGRGEIVESHDNIPGFREHEVDIDCDRCINDWEFAKKRPVYQWGLVPKAA